jgi:L-glutamine:2-deoxy-scyllo-inosose/3-amino-2,3-dideoxy-scyllo-inosose aminotransferase
MRIQNKHQVLGGPLMVPQVGWPEYGDPERRAIEEVLPQDWGIDSKVVAQQENEFRRLLGLSDAYAAISCTNGTHAIQLILESLNVGYGDRVIVPGLTWQATAAAVVDVNGIPVILDVDDTWTLDPDLVEAWLARTQGTPEMPVAVIVVDVYNRAARRRRFFEICKRYGVWLIEDCAHSQGAIIDGRPAMGWGVASSTSRQSSKPRATGEGGDTMTCVPVIEQRLRALVSCGRMADATIPHDAEVDEVVAYWRERVAAAGLQAGPIQSGNYRINAFAEAVARAQNQRFGAQHAARQRTLRALDEVMPGLPGITWAVQPAEVRSPVGYRIAFEYDPDEFAGMDNDTFRESLAFLLGEHPKQKVERIYEPLNDSPHYKPLTKKRHHISDDYVLAIDPQVWDLPRCTAIYERAVTIEQSFAREAGAAEVLPRALMLMHERAEQIVAAAV